MSQTPSLGRQIFFKLGTFSFRYRNQIFPLIFSGIFLYALAQPGSDSVLRPYTNLIGTFLALAGQFYRLFVIGYAYIRRGGKRGEVYADVLVTEGLYAHSRNPMYFGNILIAVGFSLLLGTFAQSALVISLFLCIYYSIVIVEEDYLRTKFPQAYSEYERQVPRFVPNFRGLSRTLARFRYDWRTALIKEYGTLCGTLAGLTFILFYQHFERYPTEFFPARPFWAFLAIETTVVFLYVSTRRMKKALQRRERSTELHALAARG